MPITFLKEDNIHYLPVKDGGRDTIYWDSSTYGLGLRVYSTGNRVYVVRYTTDNGHVSHKTLGSVDRLTLQSARGVARYRRKKATESTAKVASPKTEEIRPHGYYQKRTEKIIQCQYTKEGIHHFKTKREDAKYCCQAHFHLAYNRTVPSNYTTTIWPTNTIPDVIYLPDETQERISDLALLQHQLDELEQRIDQLVEEKLEEKLQQMAETLTGNLLALFTTKRNK